MTQAIARKTKLVQTWYVYNSCGYLTGAIVHKFGVYETSDAANDVQLFVDFNQAVSYILDGYLPESRVEQQAVFI